MFGKKALNPSILGAFASFMLFVAASISAYEIGATREVLASVLRTSPCLIIFKSMLGKLSAQLPVIF